MVSMIFFSVSPSNALVGSSKTITSDFLKIALAIPIRWICPPEREDPPSPTSVLNLWGKELIKLINVELAKCALGETDSKGWVKVMDGYYYCNWYNLRDRNGLLMNAVVEFARYKDFKNPFQPDKPFVEYSASVPTNDIYLGKLIFHKRNILEYCIKLPCNDGNNRKTETQEFFKDGY